MVRRREFWFALMLFTMAILPLFAIDAVQEYGQFMMVLNHNLPHTDAAAFAAEIYESATRPLFISIGILCSWFFLFGSWEVLLLVKRIRLPSAAKYPAWVFAFASLPVALIFSVAAYQYFRS